MFYKHWKKIALAVTSFFWVSCDNDPSSASEQPASSSSIEEIKSSATTGAPTSSSSTESAKSSATADDPDSSSDAATQNSSSTTEEAASSADQDEPNVNSSTSHKKSSNSGIIAAKYGVPMSSSEIAAKYGVPMSSSEMVAPKYGVPMSFCERTGESTLTCDDGVTCTEVVTETQQVPECTGDQLCAKYGVVVVKETTYKCDNGKVYNYAEFQSKYTILDGAVDLYGCPSDICGDPSKD